MKKLLYLQHVSNEPPGMILDWAGARGITCKRVSLFNGEAPPPMDELDFLVVMGGPMGVYDDDTHPWLHAEKSFIGEAIKRSVPVLGICLGAQLMAHVLGAEVTRNTFREVGYFPVTLVSEVHLHPLFWALPRAWTPLHWHGDTFGIPKGSLRIASSEACINQGFVGPGAILGLQFHLETDVPLTKSWVGGSNGTALPEAEDDGRFIQPEAELLDSATRYTEANRAILYTLLDRLFHGAP
jgi:GMP synthase (glutamine-hydrolysing)